MGQCTSGELPPPTPDRADAHNAASTQCSPEKQIGVHRSSHFPSRRRSTNSSWVNKFKKHKNKELSATFNMLDYDAKANLLNINTAPEEELMTLPGITRSVAKNITDYRTAIGGFRRVEDLALVSGVGASKLQGFKCDITVKRRSSSRSSSLTQSVDSLPSCESGRSQQSHTYSQGGRSLHGSPIRAINVNTASIFDLMNVRGMNQEMAANIVEYRERKGLFKSIEELIKVRGISARVLNMLKMYLVVDSGPLGSPQHSDVISVASSSKVHQRTLNGRLAGHRRTYSAPLNNEGISRERPTLEFNVGASPRISGDFSADIFELLSLRSERPIIHQVFSGCHEDQPAIRIATWNLQQLTKDKISNPGVLEVVCRTILENGFSLLAIQEVGSRAVLEKICCELNQNSLRRVKEWMGPKGEWRWQVSEEPIGNMAQVEEFAAFIYNVDHNLQLISSTLLGVHNNNDKGSSPGKPYLGYFKSHKFEFVVVNLHIKGANFEGREHCQGDGQHSRDRSEKVSNSEGDCANFQMCQLTPIVNALREKLVNEKNILLLGDFNINPEHSAFDVLRELQYSSLIAGERNSTMAADGEAFHDNIWLSSHTQAHYTGKWGTVVEGLCHLAIPCGWGWGGAVSSHCPIYCDLYSSLESART